MVRVSPRVLCGHCRGAKPLTGRFGRRRPRTGIPELLDRHWTVAATDVTGCARPDQLRPPCKARSCRPISSSSHFFVKPWTGISERRRLYTQTGLADSFSKRKGGQRNALDIILTCSSNFHTWICWQKLRKCIDNNQKWFLQTQLLLIFARCI